MNPKKFKLLILSPGLPIPPTEGGAIETVIAETAPFYQQVDTHIFSESRTPRSFSETGQDAVHYRQFQIVGWQSKLQRPLNRLARRGFFWLYDFFSIRRFMNAVHFEPDILHLHNNVYTIPTLRKKFPKAKIILHMHNDFLFEFPFLLKKYQKILKQTDYLITVSNHVADRVKKYDPSTVDKITAVHNGVSLKTFNKIDPSDRELTKWRDKLGLTGNEKTVLFVGRIHSSKGADVLMRAFKSLISNTPKVKLLVVGTSWFLEGKTTPYLRMLREEAQAISQHVIFTGFISHTELNYLYNLADICVVPSVFEDPCPLVVHEAMAAGTCLVASRVGGIPELVEPDRTGIIVPPSDHKKLAETLKALIQDDEKRRLLAQNASRAVRENYGWPSVAARYEQIYRGLMR